MNKNQPRKAEQDSAEGAKNKNWDPNAPLLGRTRRGPPRQPASRLPAPSGGRVRIRQGRPTGRQSASGPQPPPTGGSHNRGRSARRSGQIQVGATADPFTYLVQAGAFRTPEDAEAQRAKLSLMVSRPK
ncbi:SPOR domain-containing protein [Candidatus Skiveiella danica]|uniref:SPOR domain-containing protein n=1 Tax=Candidatus Skiveiella danica TaxID=3386177 RepID=UPI0039B8703B